MADYFQVGEQCYAGQLAAAHAAAAAAPVGGQLVGSDWFTCQFSATGSDAGAELVRTCSRSGVTGDVSTVAYVAQPCGLLTPTDAVTLGWQIGGAWLVVGLLMFLRRTVR